MDATLRPGSMSNLLTDALQVVIVKELANPPGKAGEGGYLTLAVVAGS